MSDSCELRAALEVHAHCDEEACIYWRVARHVGVDVPDGGCAIQHFQLLEGGDELASWLLSVKTRVDAAKGNGGNGGSGASGHAAG